MPQAITPAPIGIPSAGDRPSPGRSAGLWAGVFGSSAIWALQLQICYGSVPVFYERHALWVSHVVSFLCFGGTILCGYLSYRDWAAAGQGSPDQLDGGPRARQRFLGALGLALSAMLAMTILAQAIAAFFFDPGWV